MSSRVVVTRTGARQLAERRPESAATACVEFLFGPSAEDAHRVGAPLRARFGGQWRARGEHRARYRIDDNDRVVHVLAVDHRRGAYRS